MLSEHYDRINQTVKILLPFCFIQYNTKCNSTAAKGYSSSSDEKNAGRSLDNFVGVDDNVLLNIAFTLVALSIEVFINCLTIMPKLSGDSVSKIGLIHSFTLPLLLLRLYVMGEGVYTFC